MHPRKSPLIIVSPPQGYNTYPVNTHTQPKHQERHTETDIVEIDGKTIEIKDQIQLMAPNEVLDNPLLSLVTLASLGGLCPLLIVRFYLGVLTEDYWRR
jgi:hypothetical protein